MSLYAEYVKECVNWETIEDEDSFITFQLQTLGPVRCMKVIETYTRPEARGKSKTLGLFAQVEEEARKQECKYISALISKNYPQEFQNRTAHICTSWLNMKKEYEDDFQIVYRREVN